MNNNISKAKLNKMIDNINSTESKTADTLSHFIYVYSRENDTLSLEQ